MLHPTYTNVVNLLNAGCTKASWLLYYVMTDVLGFVMRSSSSVLFLLLASPFLAVGAILLMDMPNCEHSNADPDGDGRGWENNTSCRVVVDKESVSFKTQSLESKPASAPVMPIDAKQDLNSAEREIQG